VKNTGDAELSAVYACEFTLTVYSDQDPGRYYHAPEHDRRREVHEIGAEYNLRRFDLVNGGDGLTAILETDRPVSAAFFPLMTVSMSEEGVEKTYQGSTVFLYRPLTLAPGQEETFLFNVRINE
jgi:hypothetical protein